MLSLGCMVMMSLMIAVTASAPTGVNGVCTEQGGLFLAEGAITGWGQDVVPPTMRMVQWIPYAMYVLSATRRKSTWGIKSLLVVPVAATYPWR